MSEFSYIFSEYFDLYLELPFSITLLWFFFYYLFFYVVISLYLFYNLFSMAFLFIVYMAGV